MASFWCLYCWLWTYLTSCSSVSIVNFKHVIAGWVKIIPGKRHSKPFFNFYSSKSLSLLCFIDMTLMQTFAFIWQTTKSFYLVTDSIKNYIPPGGTLKNCFFPGKVSQTFYGEHLLFSFSWESFPKFYAEHLRFSFISVDFAKCFTYSFECTWFSSVFFGNAILLWALLRYFFTRRVWCPLHLLPPKNTFHQYFMKNYWVQTRTKL